MIDRLDVRVSEKIHAELLLSSPTKPRFGVAAIGLLFVSIVVTLVNVALVVGGVWIMVTSSAPLFSALIAVPMVLCGLWPYVGLLRRGDRRQVVLAHDDFGDLYEMVAALAADRSQGVSRIHLDLDWNASVRSGWRGRSLTIGLPLWLALDQPQRAAVIGHELGHFDNGDPRRSWVAWSAMSTVQAWRATLDIGARGVASNLILMIIKAPIKLLEVVIDLLSLRERRRAEYFADVLGSQRAGSDAMIGALTVTATNRSTAEFVLRRGVTRESLGELVATLNDLTPTERLRRARRAELRMTPEPSATHPPVGHRIAVLRAHPFGRPAVIPLTSDQLDERLIAAGVESVQGVQANVRQARRRR